jgi:hypothetical protein
MAAETANNFTRRELELVNDPSTSYWLKQQITKLQNRDVLDGLIDAEILVEVLKEKAELISNKAGNLV